MHYAIVINDTITATGRARDLWPEISFPADGPREDWLLERHAQPIRNDPPHDPATHYLRPVEPYLLERVVYRMEAVPIPEPEPEPQWVAFGSVVMVDPQVNAMLGTALSTIPGLYGGLTVGLGQVAQGDPQTFLAAWGGCLQAGLVTAELAAHVAELAAPFHLPAEFVAALEP
jgi:hypothetical protein